MVLLDPHYRHAGPGSRSFRSTSAVQRIGAKQQLRVLATYAGGEVRDVTREAFLDYANSEVALAGRAGLLMRSGG